jgi:hypothetical protein
MYGKGSGAYTGLVGERDNFEYQGVDGRIMLK